jgi:hypothetical protein
MEAVEDAYFHNVDYVEVVHCHNLEVDLAEVALVVVAHPCSPSHHHLVD